MIPLQGFTRISPLTLAFWQRRFRSARMRAFLAAFKIDETTRILDVGGTPDIWSYLPTSVDLTLLNRRATQKPFSSPLAYVEGDGCFLPFADKSFDIVFSNSVIEHVGSADAQRQFAREVARVGKSYWVQTPDRHFPIETHLLTPLVHLLPRRWSAFVLRRFTVIALLHRLTAEEERWYVEHFLNDIRLLTSRDMAALFPGSSIRKERFLFFSKSLIAISPHAVL